MQTDRYHELRDALWLAEKTGETFFVGGMTKEIADLIAEHDRLQRIATAAQALANAALEYEFDDGLGRGAALEYWEAMDDALDPDAALAEPNGEPT